MNTSPKKKLSEVALPLEAVNKASAKEKSIRHGHPSTLHLWWARRPLAASRAVLFASLVDDPSGHPAEFPTEEAQERERQRLFRIIETLVRGENSANEQVLEEAGAEIMVIAWLWARTVQCPNPVCGALMPLISSFWLSTKHGKKAWVEPIVDLEARQVRFQVRTGDGGPSEAPKIGRGAKFRCLVC